MTFEMEENDEEILSEILPLFQRCTSWLWYWVNKSERRNMHDKEKSLILIRMLVHVAKAIIKYLKFCLNYADSL